MRLLRRLTVLAWLDVAAVLAVIVVTVWSLHPSLLLSGSLITGGDTGSHLVLPAFLRSQGDLLHVTPWYPGWFDGMPAYTYYFVLPDYLAVLGSYVIGFAVAFKLATIAGSVLLPVAAYVMARPVRCRQRWPWLRCRSCSTRASPSTGATCSRRWRASTHSPCRWVWP